MSELLAFALTGLGAGALFACLAMGVVLNYRGCGAVNLSLGAVAMAGAFIFYELKRNAEWPVFPALVVTLVVCGGAGALFDWVAFRRLRDAPAISKLIVTLGLLLALQAAVVEIYGSTALAAPSILPHTPSDSVDVAGIPIPINRFILAAFTVVVAAALVTVYRWTRFGLATRAAAENERAAVLAGYSTNRLSLINTTGAFTLAGAIGVLVAPITQLDSSTLVLAIVPALAAALVAGFTSFGIAAAAGLAMGIIEAVILYLQTMDWFPTSNGAPVQGITDVFYLLVIVVMLIWRGAGLPERGALVAERMPRAPAPVRLARPAILLSLLVVLLLVVTSGGMRQAVITSLIAFVACLPFVVLVGYVGQLSLAQLAFAGIAGLVTSRMADEWGIGFPLGPLIAIAVATVFGTLLAIPALRVRGVHLAIVTIAAAVAIANFGFGNEAWGARLNGDPVDSPHVFGVDFGTSGRFWLADGSLPSPMFGFLCLAVALVLGLLVVNLRRGHLGRWMLAVRGNERAAAATGLSVRNVKLVAFAISAMLAGFAGVLYAYNFGAVSSARYELVGALSFLAFAYIAGIGSVGAAVVAGVMAVDGVVIHLTKDAIALSSQWWLILGGLMLIFIVTKHPDGIVNTPGAEPPPPFNYIDRGVRRLIRRVRATRSARQAPEVPAEPAVTVSKVSGGAAVR
ncbi:ABC transporter permease [Blastococcus sp. SYSU D00820]